MTVYVIMSNDFPEKVFTNEAAAETYCRMKMEEQRVNLPPHKVPRIYYHHYAFEVEA